MANSRKQELGDDCVEQSNDDSETSTVGSGNAAEGTSDVGLTERLTNILVDEGDGDLLLQQSDREDRVMQWLQALDMQVIGACRADERLKPLLKMNASSGLTEDRLLVHLSQHFEPSEVGMLARCFCIPLVSIRVGKINKQGNLFRPTTLRGNLCLTLLPTSDLRLSFIGDDGNTERLFTVSSKARVPCITVDEIPADSSGRSFHIKLEDGGDFYFWCSEKSKLLGIELLAKMKDILKGRPSIAELTGISRSRLACFATHLRAYLVGISSQETTVGFPASSSGNNVDFSDTTSTSLKPRRSGYIGSQAVKTNSSYQGSLSPRSSPFKEGPPRSLSSLRNAASENLKLCGDVHLPAVDNLMLASSWENDASSSNESENEKLPDIKNCTVSPSALLESLGKLAIPPSLSAASHVTSCPPPLSPYYCWCPQGASTMQYPSASSQLTASSIESPLLPPLSSLLSGTRTSNLLTPVPPLSLADVPALDFPALLPDPLVRLPIASSQQIPTFTPLMCDPIVHIPVVDVCSSGQGYLVSAGPAISSTIPPMHTKLVNPLIPETESVVEKGARETLRLLISSSTQTNPQLMDVLPAVLTNADNKHKQGIHAVGSRGLYTGSSDVNAIVNSMATIGWVSLAKSSRGIDAKVHDRCDNFGGVPDNVDNLPDGDGSSSDYEKAQFPNREEETN